MGIIAAQGSGPNVVKPKDKLKTIGTEDLKKALDAVNFGASSSTDLSDDRNQNPWQNKLSKKEKREKQRQNVNNQMLQAGIVPASNMVKNVEYYHMFVGGLHESSTNDKISQWLNKNGIKSVTEVTKISPDDRPYTSFHIVMQKRDYIKIIKNKTRYWPKDVTCRRYFIAEDKDDDDEVRAVGNTLDCGLADGKSETDAHTGSESAMESENVQEETSIST